ncbi:hypothetical protein BU25DRAFT_6914 [Macroventuria anomochaeta]|uniref:Uncharacterized protein n=1 Tax=Macroventuria anomochaeta TaxID=301207 RepID=A0ACB6SJM2_9PLEO|nr:uncharacterized protein BU25DRAFT_6914 [Macroventuria anomochaeta]KAF2633457.1 hypothetical protein BU25DRAFT_6914 [Macroventuria anomochaeta]
MSFYLCWKFQIAFLYSSGLLLSSPPKVPKAIPDEIEMTGYLPIALVRAVKSSFLSKRVNQIRTTVSGPKIVNKWLDASRCSPQVKASLPNYHVAMFESQSKRRHGIRKHVLTAHVCLTYRKGKQADTSVFWLPSHNGIYMPFRYPACHYTAPFLHSLYPKTEYQHAVKCSSCSCLTEIG